MKRNKQATSSKLFLRLKRSILMIVLILGLGSQLFAQVAGDFRSTSSGNWNTSTSWERFTGTVWEASGTGFNNPGQIPGSSNSVFIQATHTISIDAAAFCSIMTINSGASLIASNFPLDVDSDWINNGSFISGIGSVNFNGTNQILGGTNATTFNNLNINSSLGTTLASNCVILGNLNTTVGTLKTQTFNITVNGLTTVSGTGSIKDAGAGLKQYNGGLFINGGSFVSTVAITIPSTGILTIALGNLTVNAGTGVFTVSSGVVTTLQAGNISVAAGQTLNFNNTLTMSGGVITGNGAVVIDATFNMSGGTFNGAGSTTINAPNVMNILGGPSTISRNVTTSILNWIDGDIIIGTGSILSATTINVSSAGTITGNGTLSVSGLGSSFTKSSLSTTVINSGIAISSPAVTSITNGTLLLGGSGTFSGATSLGNGTTLQFSAGAYSFNSPATITGSGNLIISGATVNTSSAIGLSAAATISISLGTLTLGSISTLLPPVTLTGGILSITGATTFAGLLTNNGGSINTTAPVTIANTSGFVLQSGALNVNAGTGTFTVSSNTNMLMATGTCTIATGQTLSLTGTTTMTSGTITGAGSLTVSGAFLMNAGSMSGAGTATILSPGSLTIDGSVSITRPLNVNTTFNWLSGNITMLTGAIIAISNGAIATFSSAGIISSGGGGGGIITVSGAGTLLQKTGASTSTINAVCNITSPASMAITEGILLLGGGGTFTGATSIPTGSTLQLNTGTFTINTPASITGSGNLIISGATVNTSSAIGLSAVATISISLGTLTLGSISTLLPPVTLTGGILSITGATTFAGLLTNNGGSINTTAPVTIANTSGFVLQSGNVNINTGTGTFSVPINVSTSISGGTISIASAQILSVAGNTTMSGGTINGVGSFIQTAPFLMSGGTLNGSGITTIASPGSMTISGSVTISRNVNTNTLNWTSGNIALSAALTVGNNMTTNSSGIMSGSGDLIVPSLTKSGASTTTINNQMNAGTGAVSINAGLLVLGSNDPIAGNLTIASNAKLRVTNGKVITAQTLTLGGNGAVAGSWGSSSTAAANKDDTYFDLGTTGIVQVSLNTCIVPIAGISAPTTVLTCLTNSINLTATGSGFYFWDNTTNNGVRSINSVGTYSLTVSSNGCGVSTTSITITQDTLTPSVTAIGGGFTKTCIANITGNIIGEIAEPGYSYSWLPIIGLNNAAISNPIANPLTTTVYTVTKTKISSGCTANASVTVIVNTTTPIVSAGNAFTKNCAINISGAAIGENNDATATYTWSPVNGLNSVTTSNPIANPTTTTTYTVTKTSTSNGCASLSTVLVAVDISAPTSVSISSPSMLLTCITTSIELTASAIDHSNVSNLIYLWSGGGTGISKVITTSGIDTVTVTDPDNGCSTTSSITITQDTLKPTVTLSSPGTAICIGSLISLTASGADNYTWAPVALNGTSILVSPNTLTTYTVTGTNTISGCSNTAIMTITVNTLPSLNVSATATTICEGAFTTISATGASIYTWSPGALSVNSIAVSPPTTTTYTVTGTNSGSGCSKTATITITVNALPIIGTTASATSVCIGSSTTIVGNGASTYSWQPGSLNGASITVSPISSTTYTITGTNASGCLSTATRTIVANNCTVILNLKLFIEGYYDGNNTMKPVRANQGIGNSTTNVDFITIELHNATTPFATVASTLVFLKTNGTAIATFTNVIPSSYFIVVKHRNAVETWSANPITTGTSTLNYDFSTGSNKAFGNNMVEIEPGVWALYSGDITSDDNIDLLDLSFIELDITDFAYGFLATDINGDGNVDLLDYPIVENNITNFIFSQHP